MQPNIFTFYEHSKSHIHTITECYMQMESEYILCPVGEWELPDLWSRQLLICDYFTQVADTLTLSC